ncbi:hypothetical protein BK659_02005 [Pseudomonas brassicacearum]|uniref:Calcium-binding protein n=2 Tax=Pseudomonas brassicacearum TaxID=930166 RepID=A0A423HDF8_9PSED|nr:hypothetical protein BK659_02005 [Pseudomonas brassicacearum]
MGARLNGRVISAGDPITLAPDQTFVDALQFDPAKVEGRLQSPQHSDACAGLLFELGVLRSASAQSLLTASSSDLSVSMQSLGKLLDSAQQLSLSANPLPDNLPSWVDRIKSRGMTSMGVGLQGYGIYSGIMGTAEALKKGDLAEAAINVGGIGAEVTSLFAEKGLESIGRNMILNGGKVFAGFSATSAGKLLARGAGLLASVLTLPFDIYTAIKSFTDAANATGKQAQDHYFSAGLSLTSAGLSLALGVAALAGFSAAGPIGIAAAAVLILGARIYSAARQVDDIDDYITLSTHERWRSGWFAFTGQALDQDILDRFLVAKTDTHYGELLKKTARGWLDNELKDSVEAVVLGNYRIELQPAKHWKHQWDTAAGESPYTEAKEPGIRETDDAFDASEGISRIPGVILGNSGENKAILWQLGGGDDTVVGVRDKPNQFSYGAGKKNLTGGDKDDHFSFRITADTLQPTDLSGSLLRGGDGNDTLQLEGNVSRDKPHQGARIDLQTGQLSLRASPDSAPLLLESIETVETLAGTANLVTGSSQSDRIVLRGSADSADAAAGADTIAIRGFNCRVDGGPGEDHYIIADETGATTLIEDGQDPSLIDLDWAFERIQSWRIEGTSLVLETLRGIDGELPETTVTVIGVYRQTADKRYVQNDKLVFRTKDLYSLKPDLPQQLDGHDTITVNAIILAVGQRTASPQLLKGGDYAVSSEPHSGYFVYRHLASSVLDVQHENDSTVSTLYLDYDSQQIEAIEASYTVSSTRTGNFDYLRYKDIDLTLRFTDQKCLTLKNMARNRPTVGSNVGASLIASGLMLRHNFVLVMRDGISCRVQPPQYSYIDDHRNPGRKTVQSSRSLVYRSGRYLMKQPSSHPAIVLKPQAQRVDIDPVIQSGVHVLEGQAAAYELYPAADTILRLTTSAAIANSQGTSTWNIHTQHLSDPIGREHIRLSDTQLWIGHIIILLPNNDEAADAPMETVRVFTSSGHRYDVEQEFALVHLAQLNAQAYASVEAIEEDIRQHHQGNQPMAELVLIRHLHFSADTTKTVYYDSVAQDWTLEGDWSRKLHNEDMSIAPTPVVEAAVDH